MSNVFLVRGGQTAHAAPGPLRRRRCHARAPVLASAGGAPASPRGGGAQPADLNAAQEIFLTNALTGDPPGARLADRALTVGPVTRRLRRALAPLLAVPCRAARGRSQVTASSTAARMLAAPGACWCSAAAAAAGGYVWLKQSSTQPGRPHKVAYRGRAGYRACARCSAHLEAAGTVRDARAVQWYMRLTGRTCALRPVTTRSPRTQVPRRSSTLFNEGKVVLEQLTVVEGATFADFLDALAEHPHVAHTLRGKTARGGHGRHRARGRAARGTVLSRTPTASPPTPRRCDPRARLRGHAARAHRGLAARARADLPLADPLSGADPRLDRGEGGRRSRANGARSPGCSSTACARACGCSRTPR